MKKFRVLFLHGFWGLPSDAPLILPQELLRSCEAPNLFASENHQEEFGFSRWVDTFYDQNNFSKETQNVLVGYSMGGRLALHLLEKNQQVWSRVILISTNTGFDDDWISGKDFSNYPERQQRLPLDQTWSHKFLAENPQKLWEEWNNQSFFKTKSQNGHQAPLRFSNDEILPRTQLAHAMTHWSLAYQKNMRPIILKNASKIISILGEEDSKYRALWEPLASQDKNLTLKLIPNAAHRIFMDQQKALKDYLEHLIKNSRFF